MNRRGRRRAARIEEGADADGATAVSYTHLIVLTGGTITAGDEIEEEKP